MYAHNRQIEPQANYSRLVGNPSEGVEAKQSEVNQETSRLHLVIDNLGVAASRLAERLHPVLRQSGIAGNKPDPAPEPVLCPMAETIRSQRRQLEDVLATLETATSQLEL